MSALPYAHKELYENDTLDISIYAGILQVHHRSGETPEKTPVALFIAIIGRVIILQIRPRVDVRVVYLVAQHGRRMVFVHQNSGKTARYISAIGFLSKLLTN